MNKVEGDKTERPWRTDKRSWIFYQKTAKADEYLICEDIGESVFLLDCQKVRLSIWSKRWSTVLDVGVQGLLEAENILKSIKNEGELRGTHIYYKGMELEHRRVDRDTSLIDFIDIKKDLDRNYININRYGFTEKGEQFFREKLYPNLLTEIRDVLTYLEKTAEEGDKNKNFCNTICKSIQKRCEDIARYREEKNTEKLEKEKRNIAAQVISASILAYYAVRDEWELSGKLLNKETRKTKWIDLIKKMNEILEGKEELLEELAEISSFFNINIYDRERKGYISNGARGRDNKQRYTIIDFFREENKWAVLQIRKDLYSNWRSCLVLLGRDRDREFYGQLEEFPFPEKKEKSMEGWGKDLFRIADNLGNTPAQEQQFFLDWILQNIPTIALFANDDGNVRVNVLGSRISPSVYMNKNFKGLILQRMVEVQQKEGIQRFSVPVWQRRECMSCSRLPYSIYFIRRGYLYPYSLHRAVVPFDGDLLHQIQEVCTGHNSADSRKKIMDMLHAVDIRRFLHGLLEEETKRNEISLNFERNRSGGEAGSSVENGNPGETEDYDRNKDRDAAGGIEQEKRKKRKSLVEYVRSKRIARLSGNIFEFVFEIYSGKELKGKAEQIDFNAVLEKDQNFITEKCNKAYMRILEYMYQFENRTPEELTEAASGAGKNEFLTDENVDFLCLLWYNITNQQDRILNLIQEVRRVYEDYIGQNDTDPKKKIAYQKKRDRICAFIKANMKYNLSDEALEAEIKAWEEDLLSLFHEWEVRDIRELIEKNLQYYAGRERKWLAADDNG